MASLRMRQSLSHFEEEFRQDMEEERERSQLAVREVRVRSRKRGIERRRKRSSMRYWMLVLGLLATAVGVTVAMFETLYLILG
jgi:hypothetical protein